MSEKKIKLNTEWLSVCGGCHVALVDLHEKLLDVLERLEIQRCPLLTDVKDYPKADIGLVCGAVRNEHDVEVAHKMRDACDLIVGFGTCAVFGGIPGAALAHSREEIIDRVYVHNPTTKTSSVPTSWITPLSKMVTPLDEVIDVDLYLPGCPPHASFIVDAMFALIEKREPKANTESVCGRCQRKMVTTDVTAISESYMDSPDEKSCFLSQGHICLGSVTLDRCLSPCPNNGVACIGCAGPTMQILTEPNRDIRTEVATRMAKLTKIPRSDIIEKIEHSAKSHYAFAMATKMVGSKPTFLINKWIAEVEGSK